MLFLRRSISSCRVQFIKILLLGKSLTKYLLYDCSNTVSNRPTASFLISIPRLSGFKIVMEGNLRGKSTRIEVAHPFVGQARKCSVFKKLWKVILGDKYNGIEDVDRTFLVVFSTKLGSKSEFTHFVSVKRSILSETWMLETIRNFNIIVSYCQ